MEKVTSVAQWRAVVASARGPESYTMRLLLLALAVLMGEGRPPIQVTNLELQIASNLSNGWMVRVMHEAESLGWFRRKRGPSVGGAFLYWPLIPLRDVEKLVPRETLAAQA